MMAQLVTTTFIYCMASLAQWDNWMPFEWFDWLLMLWCLHIWGPVLCVVRLSCCSWPGHPRCLFGSIAWWWMCSVPTDEPYSWCKTKASKKVWVEAWLNTLTWSLLLQSHDLTSQQVADDEIECMWAATNYHDKTVCMWKTSK